MDKKYLYIFLIIVLSINLSVADKPCVSKKFNHDSIVCVCNSTYCDEISKVQILTPGNFILYTSTQEGERFNKTFGKFHNYSYNMQMEETEDIVLNIKRYRKHQSIMGFGGFLTDSTAINILNLNKKTQNNFIDSYFSKKGLEYNMIQIPMGSTDFSTHFYTYNETPEDDSNLSNFTLTPEDLKYKIPILKRAQAVSTSKIHLMTSSSYSPSWMRKTTYSSFESQLLPKYYQTWADYHLRFLEEYDKLNIQFDMITLGTKPCTSTLPSEVSKNTKFLGWEPQNQATWLVENFYPTIKKSKFHNISILTLNDQRDYLPIWITFMSTVNDALKYVDGIAVNWYSNKFWGISLIYYIRHMIANKFMITNEASISGMLKVSFDKEIVHLGDWDRGEKYLMAIIDDLNDGFVGWMDSNMALNMEGGPNWLNNFADASIIVNKDKDEFYKQPSFYAMGHVSKFIPRNSIRISVNINVHNIHNVAFLRTDQSVVLVLINRDDVEKTAIVEETDKGHIKLKLKPKSFNTLVYS